MIVLIKVLGTLNHVFSFLVFHFFFLANGFVPSSGCTCSQWYA
uniref:Uncharacterized protein n=1 Tax=Arundo donax TaxID=35708 RepID=A0A0A9FLC6_ARUDO